MYPFSYEEICHETQQHSRPAIILISPWEAFEIIFRSLGALLPDDTRSYGMHSLVPFEYLLRLIHHTTLLILYFSVVVQFDCFTRFEILSSEIRDE